MLGRFESVSAVAALVLGFLTLPALAAEPGAQARKLIDEALIGEARGDNRQRAALLAQAEQMASDLAAIHWARGQTKLHDRWLSPEEVAQSTVADSVTQQYRARRAAAKDDVAGQWELATWCKEHDLPLQQRAHLARVLQFAPHHAAARRDAGYTRVDGQWVQPAKLTAWREYVQQQREAFQKWRPIIMRLAPRLSLERATDRAPAEQELAAIVAPEAIAAMESVLCGASPRLAVYAIEQMSAIDDPAASITLARQAIFSPWQPTRDLAAEKLQPRPVEEYAPLLLASLRAPIEAHTVQLTDAGGRVIVRQQLSTETQTAHEVALLQTSYLAPIRRPDSVLRSRTVHARDGGFFTRVGHGNLVREELNDHLMRALATATDTSPGNAVHDWWKWWDETNEVKAFEKPYSWHCYWMTYHQPYYNYLPLGVSCFVKGTPVWTLEGTRPIEKIQPGDVVLAQDVETGELAYKPVLQTTTRPPAAIVRIDAGDSVQIDATGGHRFWVAGQGWVKARHLRSGMPLHTTTGSLIVSDVSEQSDAPAYNLVVADFHTYFVTDAKVLCQDNQLPKPTAVVVPGLSP